jgi:hypothetical protein
MVQLYYEVGYPEDHPVAFTNVDHLLAFAF